VDKTKKTIIILFILTIGLSFGQREKSVNEIVTENFVKHYNDGNYKAIFSMFSAVMKNALPEDKTIAFFKGLKHQAGNVKKREFLKYINGTYASYKTKFERTVFFLNISIDKNSKINGLFVKPFVKESDYKTVINNLTVKDGSITGKELKIIFENVKVFPNNTELSIAIIKNGKVGYYGIYKKKKTISEIKNKKSVFEIGSITKVFTATLFANFIMEGKIKKDDYINDYLKIHFKNDMKISFLSLANHSSGLPRLPTNFKKVDPNNPYKDYTEEDLKEYLTKYLELSNRGKYQYSNLGAGLLGYSLSKIENTAYEKLLHSKIFSKYDMRSSTTDINKIKGKIVRGLNNAGKQVQNWEFSVLTGAGGILSTVEDLSKFAVAQFNTSNKELKLTREVIFNINRKTDIGLGWHLLKSEYKNIWYWHNGGTGGYSSSMVIDVKSRNGIIILSNVSAFNPKRGNIDKLCFGLMRAVEKQ